MSNDEKLDILKRLSFREVHPSHGERGGFHRLTMTLSDDLFKLVVEESARRKLTGVENANISAVVREALTEFFNRRGVIGGTQKP